MENINVTNQTLSEKVREILNMHASIISKVSSSVSSIDNEISLIDKNIDGLMNIYVQREIAGDIENLKEVEKSINEAVQNKEKLTLKKQAYGRATLSEKNVNDEIPKVLELARKTMDERYKNIEEKQEEIDQLNIGLTELKAQIEKCNREMYSLHNKDEARELIPLLKYIEKRKVKDLYKDSYLKALIGGATGPLLEQYLEPIEDNEKPGSTSIMSEARYRYN